MADASPDVKLAQTSLAKTPLYAVHVARGGRMVPFAGYAMPVQYEGILAEHARCREQVALFDVSHMGELRVRGADAVAAVDALVTNDVVKLGLGRAQYNVLCAEDGTVVDDVIVYKLADDDVLVCVNASNRANDFAHFQAHLPADLDALLTDESDAWAQIAVQGPKAPELLGRLMPDQFPGLRPFRIVEATVEVAGAPVTLLAATTGYTGEPGGELYVPAEHAVAVWEALEASGADLGVGPAGLGARDTLRLEMGYCLYGQELDREHTPLEAGLGWVTKLDRRPFVGRDALLAQRAEGVPRALVALRLEGKGIARTGYPVLHGGAPVGAVTSGTKSPSLGVPIALAYVPTSLSAVGTALTVDRRGKALPAVVVGLPFRTAGG